MKNNLWSARGVATPATRRRKERTRLECAEVRVAQENSKLGPARSYGTNGLGLAHELGKLGFELPVKAESLSYVEPPLVNRTRARFNQNH